MRYTLFIFIGLIFGCSPQKEAKSTQPFLIKICQASLNFYTSKNEDCTNPSIELKCIISNQSNILQRPPFMNTTRLCRRFMNGDTNFVYSFFNKKKRNFVVYGDSIILMSKSSQEINLISRFNVSGESLADLDLLYSPWLDSNLMLTHSSIDSLIEWNKSDTFDIIMRLDGEQIIKTDSMSYFKTKPIVHPDGKVDPEEFQEPIKDIDKHLRHLKIWDAIECCKYR